MTLQNEKNNFHNTYHLLTKYVYKELIVKVYENHTVIITNKEGKELFRNESRTQTGYTELELQKIIDDYLTLVSDLHEEESK